MNVLIQKKSVHKKTFGFGWYLIYLLFNWTMSSLGKSFNLFSNLLLCLFSDFKNGEWHIKQEMKP